MKKNQQKVIDLPITGRDELNLCECPLTLLADRAGESQKTLEFTDRQQGITRKWIISGTDRYGLPCALDEPVFIAMLALTKREGLKSQKVFFNQLGMLRLLRWPVSGQSYDRLELALNRLSGVTIYTDYFWDQGEFKKGTFTLNIISESFLDKGKKKNSKNSWFEWGNRIFKSFLSGNLKNLNLDIYFDLRTPTSKRFYRLLDKRLYKNDQVSFDLQELCHEKLGISRNLIYPSLLKQALNPALKEHREKKLLSSATYIKGKNGNWILNIKRYKADPEALPLPESPLPEPATETPEDNPLLTKLTSLGIPNKKALAILKEYSPERVAAWVEALPKIKPENPAGYLLKALSENWPLHPEAQKYLDAITFELEKELREKYNQSLIDLVEKHLSEMNPEEVQKEVEEFKSLFMAHWGLDEISLSNPLWRPQFEHDFKMFLAKRLDLPSFDEWKVTL